MSVSTAKLRNAAEQGLSIALALTTTLWLVGVGLFTIPPAYALSNEVVVTDVTGTNPRIAQNGESERVFLGLNVARSDSTDVVQLQAVRVRLNSDDGATEEAVVANIEIVRLYQDSSLSGTNGVFDENDALVDVDGDGSAAVSVTRNTGGAGLADSTLLLLADDSVALISTADGATNDMFCVLDSANQDAQILVGDAVAIIDDSATLTYNRIVIALDDANAGTCGGVANDQVTLDTVLPVDLGLDAADTLNDLNTYPAGITALSFTDETAVAVADEIKVGTGLTAEIWTVGADQGLGSNTWLAVGGTIYAHAELDVVQETNQEIAPGVGNGFQAYGVETIVELGDPGDQVPEAENSGFDLPKTDSGSDAGDDLFVVLVTQGGVANQTVTATIFTNGDVEYNNETAGNIVTPAISTGTGTTSGQSKAVTFGSDGVAPTITAANVYDNDNDGAVDRVEYIFSESMANTVTTSVNFQESIGVNDSSIDTPGTDRINLAANGTWLTTTVLNDTLRFNFAGDGQSDVCGGGADIEAATTYCGATQSTGDTWTSQYNEDGTGDIVDATGETLQDQSIATTDMARPVLIAAQVRDNDNDSKVDELRITGSESWGGTSSISGITLRNTTNVPSTIYTLSSISSYVTSGAGAPANANDIIVIAVAEAGQNDVGNVFTVDYAAATTLEDSASNEARSITGLATTSGAEPVITRAQYEDADNNGQIDSVRLTFNQDVQVDEDWAQLFTISGFATPLEDEDCGGGADGGDTNNTPPLTELCILFTESGVSDTNETPDLTAIASLQAGGGNQLCTSVNNDCDEVADIQMTAINSAEIAEEDNAAPEMTSAVHYGDTDAIWETGETVQLVYSEPIDAASVASSWTNDQLPDFANLPGVALLPNTGTIAVTGNVITLTSSENATTALANGDFFNPAANEIKDFALVPNSAADATESNLNVNPTVAPAISRISTADRSGNGVLDAFLIEFNGQVAASSLVAGDFIAARGANYPAGNNANAAVTPDLTVTSVETVIGGNDSRVYVNYTESNEDTGQFPMLAYQQGTLADLAGNLVASFNRDGADPTKLAQAPGNASVDRAAPIVVHKLLRDRDMDGKIDQLLLIFSEGIDNDVANGNALVNAAHVSDGLAVAGKTLAANGNLLNNNNYQQFTFAVTNAEYQVDVNEGATADSSLPGVSNVSSGQFRDNQGNVLADFAVGNEMSDFGLAPPVAAIVDGDLIQADGMTVYIVKLVGSESFIRHIVNGGVFDFYGHLNFAAVKNVDSLSAYTMSAWVRLVMTTDPMTWRIYEVNADASKHWITCSPDPDNCAAAWLAAGGNPNGVYTINQAEMDFYTVGPSVVLGL